MDDKDFLATARKRFAAAAEDEKHLRDKFVSDLKFASPDGDDQWDPLVKMQREQAYLARRASRGIRTPTDEAYEADALLEADVLAMLDEMEQIMSRQG